MVEVWGIEAVWGFGDGFETSVRPPWGAIEVNPGPRFILFVAPPQQTHGTNMALLQLRMWKFGLNKVLQK